jgi:hypothetical protein
LYFASFSISTASSADFFAFVDEGRVRLVGCGDVGDPIKEEFFVKVFTGGAAAMDASIGQCTLCG